MAQAKLSTFLQYTLPQLQAYPPPGSNTFNTRNPAYRPEQITGISRWADFDMHTIRTRCGTILNNARLPADPVMRTPHPVVSETPIAHRVTQYITPRVVAALECAFQYEQANNLSANRTPTTMDVGDMARYANGYIPDLAIYQDNWPNYHIGTRPFNRVPGDTKPSWKWNSGIRNGTPGQRQEFKQVLSQVRKYMNDNGRCRYGFVLTDRELVAIKRDNNSGHTYISDPIPWSRQGNRDDPVLTPLLALWYLGMLAANDNGQNAWIF